MKPLSALLLAFAAIALPTDALACSCARPQPVPHAVDDATRVFVGSVTDIEDVDAFHQRVTFRVTEHFKGSAVESVELVTAKSSVMCGYPFVEDGSYVVYAHGKEGGLGASACSRTTLAIQGSDLEALRSGK